MSNVILSKCNSNAFLWAADEIIPIHQECKLDFSDEDLEIENSRNGEHLAIMYTPAVLLLVT